MYRAEEFTLACAVFDQALIEIHGPFLGFYDVKQGYLCRCFGEIEAAANSTLGTDDAVLDQRLKYLGEKCRGDILCFENTGAYAMTMSSNYNLRPRPAEVVWSGSEARVVRPSETIDAKGRVIWYES